MGIRMISSQSFAIDFEGPVTTLTMPNPISGTISGLRVGIDLDVRAFCNVLDTLGRLADQVGGGS